MMARWWGCFKPVTGLGRLIGEARVTLLMAVSPPALFARLWRVPWHLKLMQGWIENLAPKSEKPILEVGCGPGLMTRLLAGQGHAVTGVDHSRAMLARARREAPDSHFVHADAADLPFDDGSHALVLGASLINAVTDPVAVLKEMGRVAGADGRVAFLVPTERMTVPWAAEFARRETLHGFDAAALITWARRAPKMDPHTARSVSQKAGLSHIETTTDLEGRVLQVTTTGIT